MLKIGLGCVFALAIAQTVHADQLTIIARPITWTSGEVPFYITIGVYNTGTPQTLSGWTLVCTIAGVEGATGSVAFGDPAAPTNDIFADNSYAGILPSYSPTLGTIFSNVAISPVEIQETAGTLNLVDLTLFPSPDARGRFDVTVVPDDGTGTGSNWLDAAYLPQSFNVAAPAGRPDGILASVVFPVPEPSSGVILSMAILLSLVARRYRRLMRGRLSAIGNSDVKITSYNSPLAGL